MRRIRYDPMAFREIRDASAYHDAISPETAAAFLAELSRTIELLRAYPKAARLILPEVRQLSLPRFPYAIVFAIEDDGDLLVLAVAHHRRAAFYWSDRIGEEPAAYAA